MRVCANLCSWFVLIATLPAPLAIVKSVRPSPVTAARPLAMTFIWRLSMNASKRLYIALSESTSEGEARKSTVSEGVKRSVRRGLLRKLTPVRTRGRGSVAVGTAL